MIEKLIENCKKNIEKNKKIMEDMLKQLDEELRSDRLKLAKQLRDMFDYFDTETIAYIIDSLDSYLQYRVNSNIEPKEVE